jgi:DNA mismatch repair protein MSH6
MILRTEEVELDEEDEEEVVAVRSRKGKPKNSLLMSGSTPSTLGSGLTSESGSSTSNVDGLEFIYPSL